MTYTKDDIVKFDGNFFEVENVKPNEVLLSHQDGCDFWIELDYITLVCKNEDRKDQ